MANFNYTEIKKRGDIDYAKNNNIRLPDDDMIQITDVEYLFTEAGVILKLSEPIPEDGEYYIQPCILRKKSHIGPTGWQGESTFSKALWHPLHVSDGGAYTTETISTATNYVPLLLQKGDVLVKYPINILKKARHRDYRRGAHAYPTYPRYELYKYYNASSYSAGVLMATETLGALGLPNVRLLIYRSTGTNTYFDVRIQFREVGVAAMRGVNWYDTASFEGRAVTAGTVTSGTTLYFDTTSPSDIGYGSYGTSHDFHIMFINSTGTHYLIIQMFATGTTSGLPGRLTMYIKKMFDGEHVPRQFMRRQFMKFRVAKYVPGDGVNVQPIYKYGRMSEQTLHMLEDSEGGFNQVRVW